VVDLVNRLERYMRSATSDAKSRVRLMRLIWDFFDSEFGSRHVARYESSMAARRSW
jgi:aromatic ring hydroxylase